MREATKIEIGFLNITASPHPAGIYSESLDKIANTPVAFRGNDVAAILKPKRSAPGSELLEGILTVWTDIDPREPSINKITLERVVVGDDLRKIFESRGFNNRSFNYVLNEKSHVLGVELRNDMGKTISVRQVRKIFEIAFSYISTENQVYEVTLIPEDDALDKVLSLRRIDKVRIFVKRPNPGDHHADDAAEVLREMVEQKINRDERVFTRQSGTDGIELNQKNQCRARVAAENGYVETDGVDEHGEKVHRSTKEYPLVIERIIASSTTFLSALRSEVERFRDR